MANVVSVSTGWHGPETKPTEKERQVQQEMDHIGKAIELLGHDIDGLENELVSVLADDVPTPAEMGQTPMPPMLCSLAEGMKSLARAVECLQEKVQRMRRDLQV